MSRELKLRCTEHPFPYLLLFATRAPHITTKTQTQLNRNKALVRTEHRLEEPWRRDSQYVERHRTHTALKSHNWSIARRWTDVKLTANGKAVQHLTSPLFPNEKELGALNEELFHNALKVECVETKRERDLYSNRTLFQGNTTVLETTALESALKTISDQITQVGAHISPKWYNARTTNHAAHTENNETTAQPTHPTTVAATLTPWQLPSRSRRPTTNDALINVRLTPSGSTGTFGVSSGTGSGYVILQIQSVYYAFATRSIV